MQSLGSRFGVDHSRELTHTAGLFALGMLALIAVRTGLASTCVSDVIEKRKERRGSHAKLSKYIIPLASSPPCHSFAQFGKRNGEDLSSDTGGTWPSFSFFSFHAPPCDPSEVSRLLFG